MAAVKYGFYRGMVEKNPGKMIYRHKGSFVSYRRAQEYAARLKLKGKKCRVITYKGDKYPMYSLYVMAPHDFIGRQFVHSKAKD